MKKMMYREPEFSKVSSVREYFISENISEFTAYPNVRLLLLLLLE